MFCVGLTEIFITKRWSLYFICSSVLDTKLYNLAFEFSLTWLIGRHSQANVRPGQAYQKVWVACKREPATADDSEAACVILATTGQTLKVD